MINLDKQDSFDYECFECSNYVMLEKSKKNKNILEGYCQWCHLDISILYEDWEEYDKERYIKEDEEPK